MIQTIDQYIAQFSGEVFERLTILRKTIKEAAPEASEKISWGMPTFFLKSNLIHFAVAKNHIGLYPGPSGITNFLDQLTEYKTSKGAIQLPNNKPLPLELIQEIVKFRVQENLNNFNK